jgi:signal transduction histidine kinase
VATWNVGVAAAYFLAAKIGLTLATVGVTVTLVWPPSGLAIAAMLLCGMRVWPGVALGAFLANATTDAPIGVALFAAIGNPLEAVVAAMLLGRTVDFRASLERARDVLAFTTFGVLVAPIASASVGVAGLVFAGAVPSSGVLAAWFTWWAGDAMGVLMVAPLSLAWTTRPPRSVPLARLLEAGSLVSITFVVSFLVFGGLLPGSVTAALIDVAFPLLLWAALSFEHRGAATAAFLLSGLAVWGTSRGAGPFARETLGLSLVHLGAFIGVATLTSLVLAAIVHERSSAHAQRAESLVREREARREAESASHAKSDFLAVMSHELRTPLNAIIGYSSLLAEGITGPLTDPQLAQIARVRASATHLLALIEQILSLSRIETRHEDTRLERADACTIVGMATALVEPLMAAKSLALEVDLPAEPCWMTTDVTKVRQILLNLLTNAAKFTALGTVRCHLYVESDHVVFDVTDTGCGIVADDLDRVFEPFWQGDSVRRERPEGVGLGLSVSSRLAELLGGEITVRSIPGTGTTFSVRLPR